MFSLFEVKQCYLWVIQDKDDLQISPMWSTKRNKEDPHILITIKNILLLGQEIILQKLGILGLLPHKHKQYEYENPLC